MSYFDITDDYINLLPALLSSFSNVAKCFDLPVFENEKKILIKILDKNGVIKMKSASCDYEIMKERESFKKWNAEDIGLEACQRDLNYYIQQLFKKDQRYLFLNLKDLNDAFKYKSHPSFIILSASPGSEYIIHCPLQINNDINNKKIYQFELKSENKILAFEYCQNGSSIDNKVFYRLNHIVPNIIPFFSPTFVLRNNDKSIYYNAISQNLHNEGSGYNLDSIENYNLYYGLCNHSNRLIESANQVYSHNDKRRRRDEDMDFEPYVGKPKFKTRRNGSHYALRSQSRLNSQ